MGLLRLLLAISVILAHSGGNVAGFSFVGGRLAVQAFYVISGFYMAMILNENYKSVQGSWWVFLSNRLLKLLPIYWAVLVLHVVLSIGGLFYLNNGQALSAFLETNWANRPIKLLQIMLSIVFLFGQDMFFFLGLDQNSNGLYFIRDFHFEQNSLVRFLFVPQAWTVGVELTFYLIAPFLSRLNILKLFIIIIVSFIFRIFMSIKFSLNSDPWTYRFFPFEIALFCCGILSYKLQAFIPLLKKNKTIGIGCFILVGILTISYTSITIIPLQVRHWIFCLTLVFSIPFVFNLTKRIKYDRWIAEFSYPVYMVHMLVIYMFNYLLPGMKGYIRTNSIILLSLTLAWLLNHFIAIPIAAYRQKRLSVLQKKKLLKCNSYGN